MKKFSVLLTAAILGTAGVVGGVAEAGNYRPVSREEAISLSAPTARNYRAVTSDAGASNAGASNAGAGQAELKSAHDAGGEKKTAFWYDSCYSAPIIRCSSYYSPCGPRPYFPASGGYGNWGAGYGGYNGYGYGYGGYTAPSYVAPVNPGLAVPYNSPVYGAPGVGNPYLAPVGTPGLGAPGYGAPGYGVPGYGSPAYYPSTNWNGLYGAGVSPVVQPGYGAPVVTTPVYNDPVYNSPFYP